jgi:hypothetical protein
LHSIRALALHAAAVALALLAATAVSGQSAPRPANPAQRATVCILPLADLNAERTQARSDLAGAVSGITENGARAGGFTIVPPSRWAAAAQGVQQVDLVRGPVALRIGAAAGAEYVIAGLMRAETGGRTLVELKAYHVPESRLVAAVSASVRTGLAVYGAAQPAVERLVEAMRRPLPPVAMRGGPDLATRLVTLVSPDEGATILLAGEEPAGSVVVGAVTFEAPARRPIDVEIRKPGYYTRRLTVSSESEQELPALVPQTAWAVGPLLALGGRTGLGIEVRRTLGPQQAYVGFEEIAYKASDDDPRGPGYGMDTRIAFGGYLPPQPHAQTRIGFSSGIGVGTLWPDNGATALDLYLNVITLAAEINGPWWQAYLRIQADYSLPVTDEKWAGEWRTMTHGLPPISVGVLRKLR